MYHLLESWEISMDISLACTSHNHIPLFPVLTFRNELIEADTCVICSDARRILPKGIWWSLGLGVAAVLGGLRVIVG